MYVGGFRLPANAANGDTFEFGGKQLAFNPANNSLFVGSRGGRVAEVSIPGAVNTANPAAMPFSTYLQAFSDPTEGHLSQIVGEGVRLDSLLVYNNRLYGTASIYYDAMNTQRVSHYSHSLQLNEPSFSGWSSVGDPAKTGFVSGMMSVIPSEWRALLGGPVATGQCCIPVVSRTSVGPSAFSFNPAQLGATPAPASALLYYTLDHATLGPWDAQNDTYGSTTFMGGMAIIAGTRTALYIGRNGLGPNCYGNGTADQSLVGTVAADGAHYCYDPNNNAKGTHAYPYRYQIWAYDLNDFAAVKAGTKQPWDVKPYGVWPLALPTPEASFEMGGVGYDPVNQLLYVSQLYADRDGYAYRPVVHVLQLNAVGAHDLNATDPVPTSQVPPVDDSPIAASSVSTVVKSISLAVNRNAPQLTGTAITFTASVVGGLMPHEYKWMVFNGAEWQVAKNWSTVETFTWTPAAANADYRVGVWARSAGNSRDEAEASVSTPFAITAPAPVPVRSVTFAPDKAAPQNAGTAITFTAAVDGGLAVEYKWLVHDGLAWNAVTGWSSQNAFVWTPASANSSARVGLWVRSNGSTADQAEATFSIDFPIAAASSTTTPTSGPVTAVTFTSNKVAPQPAGTPITFTATADGGSGVQYKWLIHDGLSWASVTGWSTQNTFTWTPATANPVSRIGIWARRSGSVSDEPEATLSADFAITAAAGAAAPTPAPAGASAPAITVSSLTVQPGAPIQFTISGGPANRLDWISLSASSAPDATYLTWAYLNGSNVAPAAGLSGAALQFAAPSAPGTYNIRFFADNGMTKLATSATITVAASSTSASTSGPAVNVALTTVTPGAAIQFTVSGGPANATDWVALAPAAAADSGYVTWKYLSGSNTVPAVGVSSATLQFVAPSTPGTYDIRFFANNGMTKLAVSAAIVVRP